MIKIFATIIIYLVLGAQATGAPKIYDLTKNEPNTPFYSSTTNDPLSFNEAFKFSTSISNNQVTINITTAKDHYIYQNKTHVTVNSTKEVKTLWSNVKIKNDPYFGLTPTVEEHGLITFDVNNNIDGFITFTTQGCSSTGICYVPQTLKFEINKIPYAKRNSSTQEKQADITLEKKQILYFIAIGLLIALSPCTYPLIPIIIASLGKNKLLNSIAYTQGLAITYMSIGVATTITGKILLPYIAGFYAHIICTVFLFIGISLYTNKDISFGSKAAAKLESRFKSKNEVVKSFFMGLASGIFASACTAGPLLAVLTHLSFIAEPLHSAISLYMLSIGLSLPLLIIGAIGQKIVITQGVWMNRVKTLMCILIIAYPVFALVRTEPDLAISYATVASVVLIALFKKWEILLSLIIITSPFFLTESSNNNKTLLINMEQLEKGVSIVKVEADWCQTCTLNNKVLKSLDLAEKQILSLDITTTNKFEETYLENHTILGIPVTHIYKDGFLVYEIPGELDANEFSKIIKSI